MILSFTLVPEMDWMERQIPPPSWHDEGDTFKNLDDDSYCPLTSVVRRCYLNHLEQTLLQNYNSCRTQTIQRSTLQDVLLDWEQSALRSCMVTTLYQKAMRQLITAIKDDTKQHKLTSVLKATIKRSQRQHLVDVSTQTESSSSTPKKLAVRQATVNGFETKSHLKREKSLSRESSDGPFLTPPSDYPLPTPTKKAARQQLPFPPKSEPLPEAPHPCDVPLPSLNAPLPMFNAPSLQTPFQFTMPPPCYPFTPQNLYPMWPEYSDQQEFAGQPISVVTNTPAGPQYEVPSFDSSPYKHQDSLDSSRNEVSGVTPMDQSFHDERPDLEYSLCHNDAVESDINWDDIEKELSRVCGQVFTGEDGKALSDDLEPEPVPAPVPPPMVLPQQQDSTELELMGALHEAQLRARLEFIRKNWSLERQAKLKRRFIELFGREDDEDTLSQVSAKEAAKCKQRIAPWIVKHLMPLYKEKRITSRPLFKSLAKHISDLLIQRNLHPDECDVWMGVQEFFRGGTTIKCEADFAT